ncbi:hypothetical protein ACCO45_003764 [Purpureocillium lilacinum]|uniref:Uncharacterized protein n=1 Tax=Purpureocillium lilacinum TaxID=33203 RepID=A0ACC4E143_PURLI
MENARQAALEWTKSVPRQGRCDVRTQRCTIRTWYAWAGQGSYYLKSQQKSLECDPDSQRWSAEKTICDYVHVIAELDSPGCIQ